MQNTHTHTNAYTEAQNASFRVKCANDEQNNEVSEDNTNTVIYIYKR